MLHNKYRDLRTEFFRKHFPYEEDFLDSIKFSNPCYMSAWNPPCKSISTVQCTDDIQYLLDFLNTTEYDCQCHWGYKAGTFAIDDWGHIYWEGDKGLFAHLEWSDTEPEPTAESWEYFFNRRYVILNHFCPELAKTFCRDEDLVIQITDEKLNKIWKATVLK